MTPPEFWHHLSGAIRVHAQQSNRPVFPGSEMKDVSEQIDWNTLHHAYGEATNVPEILSGVASTSETVRKAAWEEMYSAISHQGSVYDASLHIIPYLLKLMMDDDIPERHRFVYFMVDLAIGCESDYLPRDFNYKEYEERLRSRIEEIPRRELDSYYSGPHIDLACWKEVTRKRRLFNDFIDHEDEELRISGLYASAWLTNDRCGRTSAKGKIESRLRPGNTLSDRELACSAIAYALCCFHAGCDVRDGLLTALIEHPVMFVRVSAAIGLATHRSEHPEVRGLLDEAAASEELENIYPDVPFNNGDLRTYAQRLIDEA